MGPEAERWLASYADQHSEYEAAALAAASVVGDAIAGRGVPINTVSCRAKKVSSARHKIEDKGYGRPRLQLTDVIGVRVITTYARGVDEVADRLQSKFNVVDFVDKRTALDSAHFGYRSVHLIIQFDRSDVGVGSSADLLTKSVVEIQVRSVVEHAWAEIEHDLRYKAGVKLPETVTRRFGAVAGALELVDREFDALHESLAGLVEQYRKAYLSNPAATDELDTARLLGLIKALRPNAARTSRTELPAVLPETARHVRTLERLGLRTLADVADRLRRTAVLGYIRNYATDQGIDPDEVSATAVVQLVALAEAKVLGQEIQVDDLALCKALEP